MSSPSQFDTNVDNYTIVELYTILGLNHQDNPTGKEVYDATNKLINEFKQKNKIISNFFQDMQNRLVRKQGNEYIFSDQIIDDPNTKQTNEWFKYQDLPQDDPVQQNKSTDRFQKIDVYQNQHVPMKREQLGINNTYEVKVAQDKLNPNLENITSRFINLDSQFRQSSSGVDSASTDYTCDLSDPLTNVLSLRLYSFQIPFTWYVIDYNQGNTCFWITNKGNTFKISIEPGNYSSDEFIVEVNDQIKNAGFTGDYLNYPPLTYNTKNGKIKIYFNPLGGFLDPTGNILHTLNAGDIFDINTNAYYTFFDFSGKIFCSDANNFKCTANQNHTFNTSLGWLMGFRATTEPVFTNGNIPVATLDLYGPKYFILVIDDFNQNHINNGLVTITELSKKLDLPNYYTPTMPYLCENNASTNNLNEINDQILQYNNLTNNEAISLGINKENITDIVIDKLNLSYKPSYKLLPSAPRTLTNAQLYTINEIIKNRENNSTFKSKAPTSTDTFALVPIKHSGLSTGDLYVEFSGSLQDSKRIYFGPVNIDRLHVKLLDDKGFLVDLHGANWSMTLISDNLYQY